jgi:hypothetical protein
MMVRRTVLWAVVAAAVVGATYHFRIEMSDPHIRLLIPPKIPLFGIIVAIGTFQYRVWRDLVAWADARLHNPQWVAFEQEHPGNAALAPWQADKDAVKANMRANVLPHNRAILFNTLAVAGMLLASSSADVAWLVAAPRDLRILRAISTGTFISVLVPILETAVRYFLALRIEFTNYQREYRAPLARFPDLRSSRPNLTRQAADLSATWPSRGNRVCPA